MIKVCLVDDQTLVRQGVRSLLELSDEIEVIAEAPDGLRAMDVIPECNPDVVLLDMRMPEMSGLDVLVALGKEEKLPPTIILTTFDDDQLVLAGIKAGARGYLLKDVKLEELVSAIKTVAGGGSLVKARGDREIAQGPGGDAYRFLQPGSSGSADRARNRDSQIDGWRLQQQGDRQFIGCG